MANDPTPIEFDELEKETDEAYCVVIDGESHWFPKSQVTIYERNKKIYAPEWLALKKGLI